MRRVAVLRFLQCLCQAKRVIMRLILRLILRLVLRSRVKAMAGNGGQPAYEQPSAFLDRFGPVVARVVPCVSVEDEGFGIRWLRWFEVEGLPPAFLRASFDMATPGAVAFA